MSGASFLGERTLWEGRPRQWWHVVGLREILMLLFFGVFFLGFALTAVAPSRAQPPAPLFFLFPVIFFGVFLVGPMWIGRFLEAMRTHYRVTDRRIVIEGWRRNMEIDLATLNYVELRRALVGPSTIYLAPPTLYEGWSWWGGRWTPALRAIDDAATVYRLISDARGRARGGASSH